MQSLRTTESTSQQRGSAAESPLAPPCPQRPQPRQDARVTAQATAGLESWGLACLGPLFPHPLAGGLSPPSLLHPYLLLLLCAALAGYHALCCPLAPCPRERRRVV